MTDVRPKSFVAAFEKADLQPSPFAGKIKRQDSVCHSTQVPDSEELESQKRRSILYSRLFFQHQVQSDLSEISPGFRNRDTIFAGRDLVKHH